MSVKVLPAVQKATFSGMTAPVDLSNLAFRVSGQVKNVHVDVGDQVKRGDVLAELDTSDLELSVEQLNNQILQAEKQLEIMRKGERREQIKILDAQLKAAEASLKVAAEERRRFDELLNKKAVSQLEYDKKEDVYQQAFAKQKQAEQNLLAAKQGARIEDIDAQKALIRSLKAQQETSKNSLKYATLTAPFDGSIATRNINPFEQVNAGQPVFSIHNANLLEVTVGISEEDYPYRDYINSVNVTLKAMPGETFPAEIKSFGIDLDSETNTYPITVRFHNRGNSALAGMSAEVQFVIDVSDFIEGEVFTIPLSAIFEEGKDKRFVWVLEGDRVRKRAVQARMADKLGVLVTNGLAQGDIVVTAGVHHLRDGQEVRRLEAEGDGKE
jgi:multidrug efflux pump subunit AcrA (membrane-fusion protein)